MVMATRNMPEFENEAQTDLYCDRRELALVGQTQFIQSLEEGFARSLSSDEAAVVAAEAHEILEALKASQKKKKSTKSTMKSTTKEPTIKAETGNGAKDGAVPEPKAKTSSTKDKGKAHERNESETGETGDSDDESADQKSVEDKPSGKTANTSDGDPPSSSSSSDDDLSVMGWAFT